MNQQHSSELWSQANRVLVGGVNSPVRAFKAVGGTPFFAASGKGALVTDVDGNNFVDYVLSWGPLILGHAHPHVVEAVTHAMEHGASFGIPTETEIRLAERIITHYHSIEKIRLVNSGTEATMSAVRLARGYTGRDLIVKVEGCYHGHVDGLLVKAGSGLTTFSPSSSAPSSPGIPAAYAQNTITMPYNDLDAAHTIFQNHGSKIACIIIEPVAGNAGVILPKPSYLKGLRDLTHQHGALLIFDEVMTGFRVAMGGAQARYGITPDLTTLGKVIGGGLPVGAYGGPAAIMDYLSPTGPVYQAGTLAGNPLATAAGLATLEVLEQPGVFDAIQARMTELRAGLAQIAQETSIPIYQTQAGTMACLFFHDGPISNYTEAIKSDTQRYAAFFQGMLHRGVYFAPSQFEACFMSSAHGAQELEHTLDAARATFQKLAKANG